MLPTHYPTILVTALLLLITVCRDWKVRADLYLSVVMRVAKVRNGAPFVLSRAYERYVRDT